jgi:hypothetical protein
MAEPRRDNRRSSDGARPEDDAGEAPTRYRLYTVEELLNLPSPEPLIERILFKGSFIVIYGQPGTAKTFCVVEMALDIALGRPWFGHATQRGPVVYIDYEGSADIGQRVRAWLIENKLPASAFTSASFLLETINILAEDDLNRLFATLDGLETRPALVVIDTLARATVGADENTSKEMGRAVAAVDRLRARYGCAVILIHHTTKKGDTERGSGTLRAASHTMIEFWEQDRVNITMHCSRQKNLQPFDDIEFDLIDIEWVGKDGKKETSCILRPKAGDDEQLSEKEKKALLALAEFSKDEGATPTEWERAAELPNTTFRRVRETLEDKNYVTKTPPKKGGGKVRITDDGWTYIEAIHAKERGGEKSSSPGTSSLSRHTPPPGRHEKNGGDHYSLPPPALPSRRAGVAGKADEEVGEGESALSGTPEQTAGKLKEIVEKKTPKHPDYKGSIMLDERNYRLAAWKGKKNGRVCLSLCATDPDDWSENKGALFLHDPKNGIWRGHLTIEDVEYELAARGDGDGPARVWINARAREERNRSA